MESKRTTVIALRTLLRPIVRLMVALGFNARDFMEVAKTVFVEVASDEYGKRGRKANTSRVAVLTGLTRREVARLRKVSASDPLELGDPMVPVGRVLSTWYQDSRYLDATGKPARLMMDPTFIALVNEHRGDIPSTTIIKELQTNGAIKIHGESVSVLSRYFMPFRLDEQAIERFGRVVGDVSGAIVRNLMTTRRDESTFEGRAVHDLVTVNATEAFRHFLDRRAQDFLEEVDDWLIDHSDANSQLESENGKTIRLGVGIYTIGGID